MSDSSQLAPRRSYARSALAPLLVFAIGILAAFLAASTTRDADREALRADLDADAAQLGLLIQSLANGLETDLTSTVGVALATGGDEAIYRARVDDGSGGDDGRREQDVEREALDGVGDEEGVAQRAELRRVGRPAERRAVVLAARDLEDERGDVRAGERPLERQQLV